MEVENKILWQGDYITLNSDGTISVSDGVGYVGEEENLKGLYEALKEIFN